MGGKRGRLEGEAGEHTGACSSMLSRLVRVKTKIRATVEKDDLTSIIPNSFGNGLYP